MERETNNLLTIIQQKENLTLTARIASYLLNHGVPAIAGGILTPLIIFLFIGPRQWLGYMFISFTLLAFIFEIVYISCAFLKHREKIKSFIFSHFYKSFQTNFNISLNIIEIYLPKLMQLSEISLESALIELRYQHTKLEGNICLFAGAVKNLGVVLTVLVLSIIIFKKSDTMRVCTQIFTVDIEKPGVLVISATVIALLLASTIAYQHLARWNYVIALTEMALKRKLGLQQGPDSAGVPKGYQ